MSLLTIPNWSFCNNEEITKRFKEVLKDPKLTVHYFRGDPDHNRTVSAFSGPHEEVFDALQKICLSVLPRIDMRHHKGVHPRIGALDVCPFVVLGNTDFYYILDLVDKWGRWLARTFEMPVFLYETSSLVNKNAKHASDLPTLRMGGFEDLFSKPIEADYGPRHAHHRLGATITGVRNFLIAINVNLNTNDLYLTKNLASHLRKLRNEGTPELEGVRVLGFPLASRELTQISINLTKPDVTQVDSVIQYVQENMESFGTTVHSTELIGVIRRKDLSTATLVPIEESQIIEESIRDL